MGVDLAVRKLIKIPTPHYIVFYNGLEKDILKDFLLKQKAEIIAMSIYEYNEEYVRKSLTETGYEQD